MLRAVYVLCAMCRFLDAGNDDLTTRSDGRRPKSAKARSRGELGTGWQRVLWGFKRGARVRDRVILENWQPRMPAQLKRFGTIVAKWGK